MLKNTKVVGIAAAIALLTGVAFAPSATAVGADLPYQDIENGPAYDSGDRIEYYVGDVRTGCMITTKVGSKSKTLKAKQDSDDSRKLAGEINAFIGAPVNAGEYTVASSVANNCADNPGFRREGDMEDEITVGDDVTWAWSDVDIDNTTDVGLEGDIEDSGTGVDLGKAKVVVYLKGKKVAEGNSDTTGYVSLRVSRSLFNKIGTTRFTYTVTANTLYYVADADKSMYVSNPF
ncbi:MAG: hypothetical protein RL294_712 [Actinomycetota bacterium]|jgi:hypothetical protein